MFFLQKDFNFDSACSQNLLYPFIGSLNELWVYMDRNMKMWYLRSPHAVKGLTICFSKDSLFCGSNVVNYIFKDFQAHCATNAIFVSFFVLSLTQQGGKCGFENYLFLLLSSASKASLALIDQRVSSFSRLHFNHNGFQHADVIALKLLEVSRITGATKI